MSSQADQNRQAALWMPLVLCTPAILYLIGVLTESIAMAIDFKLRPAIVWQWLGLAALAAGCLSPFALLGAVGFLVWGVRTGRLVGARLLLALIVLIISVISSWHVLRNVLFLGQRWS